MVAGIPLAERGDDRDGLRLDVLRLPLGPVLLDWPAGPAVAAAGAGTRSGGPAPPEAPGGTAVGRGGCRTAEPPGPARGRPRRRRRAGRGPGSRYRRQSH
ncbi:hypothetical protein GCM10022245_11220 [Streptomyces mayteni]